MTLEKQMIKLKCSPKANEDVNLHSSVDVKNSYSCYTSDMLLQLRNAWNERNVNNPNIQINTDEPFEIWKKFKETFNGVCQHEACWLRQEFAQHNVGRELYDAFAPTHPPSWHSNPNTWLTSDDIHSVMKQYEQSYPEFMFLGPSPIDYDFKLDENTCVNDNLCRFTIQQYIGSEKKKIGIVFNLDNHDQSGSHWVALYIDIPLRNIYYFDSTKTNTSEVPRNVLLFVNKIIIETLEKYNTELQFLVNDKLQHQYENTECGVYCLYFIINMLCETKKWEDFTKTRIPDHEVEKYRHVFFNSIKV